VGGWPAFTNQQVADAKARACAAYTTVRTGVSLQTHATGAADPVATPAVAVDARLSEVVSAQYLLNRLRHRGSRRRSTPSPTICWISRPMPWPARPTTTRPRPDGSATARRPARIDLYK
jgi:hypothetical protein